MDPISPVRSPVESPHACWTQGGHFNDIHNWAGALTTRAACNLSFQLFFILVFRLFQFPWVKDKTNMQQCTTARPRSETEAFGFSISRHFFFIFLSFCHPLIRHGKALPVGLHSRAWPADDVTTTHSRSLHPNQHSNFCLGE
jgi:hypothetical protein